MPAARAASPVRGRPSSPRRPGSPGRSRPGSSPAAAKPAPTYRSVLEAIEASSTPACAPPTDGGTQPQDLEFLEENKSRPGVVTLPCGLQYLAVKSSKAGAPSPKIDTPCECHYRGKLLDGTEFDSSLARGKPSTFAPKNVIQGWTIALQLMGVGDKWVLTVPPALAYGDAGRRDERRGQYIPPGAVLVFELELLKVEGPSKPKPKRPAEPPTDGSFVPVAKFDGVRDGFTFTTGAHGTGYYRDTAEPTPRATPQAPAEAEAAAPSPSIKQRPSPLFDRAPKQASRGPLSGMVMKAAIEAERTEFEQGTIEALTSLLSQMKPPTMRQALDDFGEPSDGGRAELAQRLTETLLREAQREVLEGSKEN